MATVETPIHEPAAAKVRPARLWNVVLLDDDDHSYEYVIEMLAAIFRHDLQRAFLMAKEVDETGRVIVETAAREVAELRRDQIQSYGADPRIPKCKGSMSAVIEPAA